nr:RecName: Full=Chlorophyll a-b binding protein; AltName: Full=LHCII type I CAB; Short=LHCP [Spinacia oleracea]AAB19811.1 LHC II=light-harvesting chlorophyll protein II [Spinacia oleracea L.=spinach, Peptide Chloroplast Partial, 9 aa] [Spinacia oleracea]
RKTAGKPKN